MDVELAIKVRTQPLLVIFSETVVCRMMMDFMKEVAKKNEQILIFLNRRLRDWRKYKREYVIFFGHVIPNLSRLKQKLDMLWKITLKCT